MVKVCSNDMVKGGTNLRKKAHGRHKKRKAPPGKKITVAEDMVVEESVVDECISGGSSTMDAVEEGPSSKQYLSQTLKRYPYLMLQKSL